MVNNMRHAVRSAKTPDSRTRLTPHHGALPTALIGAQTHKNVKNEDRSGYVHENTGNDDKMSNEKTGFCTKMHELLAN
jgi:hypothetical protein